MCKSGYLSSAHDEEATERALRKAWASGDAEIRRLLSNFLQAITIQAITIWAIAI